MSTDLSSADRPHRPHPITTRSSSQPKPKGILKNAPHHGSATANSNTHSLQWDEENLALTEIQKDSLMKITEPKTPFVRYNAETDTVEGDIPDLNLGTKFSYESPPESPAQTVSSTGADTSGPSSRRTSISSVGFSTGNISSGSGGIGASGSVSGGSMRSGGSGASSRSTSFNLPDEARRGIRASTDGERGGEIEEDEEMDEETAAKHAAFLRARGRHYSNEADAMKRAAQLMDEEDDDAQGTTQDYEDEDDEDEDGGHIENEVRETSRRAPPPVPPFPAGLNIGSDTPKINGTKHSGNA